MPLLAILQVEIVFPCPTRARVSDITILVEAIVKGVTEVAKYDAGTSWILQNLALY